LFAHELGQAHTAVFFTRRRRLGLTGGRALVVRMAPISLALRRAVALLISGVVGRGAAVVASRRIAAGPVVAWPVGTRAAVLRAGISPLLRALTQAFSGAPIVRAAGSGIAVSGLWTIPLAPCRALIAAAGPVLAVALRPTLVQPALRRTAFCLGLLALGSRLGRLCGGGPRAWRRA
jgi:hypothetical protein